VSIGEGSVIKDAVIMPGAKIGRNVRIERAIILNNATIEDGRVVGGAVASDEIVLAGDIIVW
jgi:glucose-1-phosphate adenylyltransferase